MPSSEVWLPIATLVGGVVLTEGFVALRDRRVRKRELENRSDDRRAFRRAIQRQSLETLAQLLGQFQIEMLRFGHSRSDDEQSPDSSQIDARIRVTERLITASVLARRTPDGELMDAIGSAIDASSVIDRADTPERRRAAVRKFDHALSWASDRVAILLWAVDNAEGRGFEMPNIPLPPFPEHDPDDRDGR